MSFDEALEQAARLRSLPRFPKNDSTTLAECGTIIAECQDPDRATRVIDRAITADQWQGVGWLRRLFSDGSASLEAQESAGDEYFETLRRRPYEVIAQEILTLSTPEQIALQREAEQLILKQWRLYGDWYAGYFKRADTRAQRLQISLHMVRLWRDRYPDQTGITAPPEPEPPILARWPIGIQSDGERLSTKAA